MGRCGTDARAQLGIELNYPNRSRHLGVLLRQLGTTRDGCVGLVIQRAQLSRSLWRDQAVYGVLV